MNLNKEISSNEITQAIKAYMNKNDIVNFIDKLRDTNKIDDDDTTCIIIRI